jgi:hypothetical protein
MGYIFFLEILKLQREEMYSFARKNYHPVAARLVKLKFGKTNKFVPSHNFEIN